ncbi:Telomere repeat-binding protein 2 [Apostasia shenzhenica]|uniref:Telomere repeat-binding protein 2 n=1 Tax=Apostasia shenzhenica TaxID=1088818 RepID=A0A2I0ALH1_9ASPA|nr:Telomere repeat-binding protein 2 [Apostasia shenzhenica]
MNSFFTDSERMVFENRLNFGSSGYRIPPMPRFPRSARGKRSGPKKIDDNPMCAFDLLATVAGKILAEEQREFASPLPSKCHIEGIMKPIQELEDQMDLDVKPSGIISSDSSVELFPRVDNRGARSRSFHSVRDKDDDENSSGCTNRSTVYSKAFKPHCIGDRRVRKMMASNYWKDEKAATNDGELSNDDEVKHDFRSRKLCYTRQWTQRSLFKRKKLFERCLISATSEPHASLSMAHGISCSTADQKSSLESPDHPVKLSIKSFKVPELFIEIPANATVGSLKV